MINRIKDVFEAFPTYQGGSACQYYDCNNGCYMKYITDTTKQEYDKYVGSLINVGFSIYDNHSIRDNDYATLKNDSIMIQIYHTAHSHITRIITDPYTRSYKRAQDVTYRKIGETTLYQMELDYRNIDCGMCYITQCADGSFFIIDSAHMNSINDHIRLHDLLRHLTPDGQKIIISGWFLTHAHQDHIVKFMDFINAGFEDYELECLYYNFPVLTVPGSEHWTDSDKQTMREFEHLMKEHTEIPVVKLHTGQKFFICDLELEVLSTHEDIYPETLSNFNNSSTVLLMTVEGCKVLFLGDADVTACTEIVARYGAYVKSDIVQVAHHGYNASNVGIYSMTDSKVALYPVHQRRYDEVINYASNIRVREMSKEIYIAGNGTAAFTLPYTLGTAVVMPKVFM